MPFAYSLSPFLSIVSLGGEGYTVVVSAIVRFGKSSLSFTDRRNINQRREHVNVWPCKIEDLVSTRRYGRVGMAVKHPGKDPSTIRSSGASLKYLPKILKSQRNLRDYPSFARPDAGQKFTD
jgi:hypothetical protein